MVFSSLFFVLFFFVACYTVYFFMDTTRNKNIVLLVSSLIFYAWSGPGFVLLLAGMTLVCYIGALRIRYKGHPKRDLVWTIAICLFLLCFFKYTTFLLSNLRLLTGIPKVVPKILLPIGISFYTFQLISYVVDVYRKEIPPQKNYAKLLLYASLFHQCIAGPIVRYKDIQERIDNRTTSLAEISRGITRFCIGLSKKAIVNCSMVLGQHSRYRVNFCCKFKHRYYE